MANKNDNDNESDIDSIKVDLVKFGVSIKTLLADSIWEIRKKWTAEDYTNSRKINIITSLIMNLGAANTNHLEDFLLIYYCQVVKLNCPDISNIKNISKDIVVLWQHIICCGGQL